MAGWREVLMNCLQIFIDFYSWIWYNIVTVRENLIKQKGIDIMKLYVLCSVFNWVIEEDKYYLSKEKAVKYLRSLVTEQNKEVLGVIDDMGNEYDDINNISDDILIKNKVMIYLKVEEPKKFGYFIEEHEIEE